MRLGGYSCNGMAITAELREVLEESMRPPVPELLDECDDVNSSISGGVGYTWSAVWQDEAREFDHVCAGVA